MGNPPREASKSFIFISRIRNLINSCVKNFGSRSKVSNWHEVTFMKHQIYLTSHVNGYINRKGEPDKQQIQNESSHLGYLLPISPFMITFNCHRKSWLLVWSSGYTKMVACEFLAIHQLSFL